MEYKNGEPISQLLADFLRSYTNERDCVELRTKHNNEKSLSLINQLRLGTYPIAEDNVKYVDELWALACKRKFAEDKKYKPLLRKSA